jgi:hypothetical protein
VEVWSTGGGAAGSTAGAVAGEAGAGSGEDWQPTAAARTTPPEASSHLNRPAKILVISSPPLEGGSAPPAGVCYRLAVVQGDAGQAPQVAERRRPAVVVPLRAPPRAAGTVTIDWTAIAANTRLLADRARGELMAVVKADGFGHGGVEVATAALANGATRLGVTCLAKVARGRGAGCRTGFGVAPAPTAGSGEDGLVRARGRGGRGWTWGCAVTSP